jgi:hypothetical protein
MRAIVVYESMFGNTHRIAEAIGRGLAGVGEVKVLHVDEADAAVVAAADLLVVGGPTHAFGMTREGTRKSAVEMAAKPDKHLALDEHAPGSGLREWIAAMEPQTAMAAAFDTKMRSRFAGRASRRIWSQLRHKGFWMALPAESFIVTGDNRLVDGEEERAAAWGQQLAAAATGHAMPAAA